MEPEKTELTGGALAAEIVAAAKEAGFDGCGIIALGEMDGYRERLEERMRRLPESRAFYRRLTGLTDPRERFPWAKALVICTTWLGKYRYPEQLRGMYAKSYFLSPESDRAAEPYLAKEKLPQWFDAQGIRWEGGTRLGHQQVGGLRYAAMAAGLGTIRKNNFFYSEKGSYLELDGYVIDRECELHHQSELRPCPEKCDLCQRACPTGTLCAPYTMDPLRCVSYCTTFGKGRVPDGIDEHAFGRWLVGCDACQDACPFNRHDWDQGEDFPGLDALLELLRPENLVKASDAVLAEKLSPRTVEHILPNEAETFRINAARVLRYEETKGI